MVPFFGDQPFWGRQVHARGVGPPPIPVEEFSLKKLVSAIEFMLKPAVSVKIFFVVLKLLRVILNPVKLKGELYVFYFS